MARSSTGVAFNSGHRDDAEANTSNGSSNSKTELLESAPHESIRRRVSSKNRKNKEDKRKKENYKKSGKLMPDHSSSAGGGGGVAGLCGVPSTTPFVVMILVLGAVAASAFMLLGITSLQKEKQEEFMGAAMDMIGYVEEAFEDYVDAGRLVHTVCRHGDVTREDFREIHESFVEEGLKYKAVQWTPNVTQAERPEYERKNREYYAEHYPYVDYHGIRGFNTLDGSNGLEPRVKQPFYFPINHMEPIAGNEAAIDLDYHSSEMRIRATNALFETRGPSLSDRLALVKKKGQRSRCGDYDAAYGVVLINPGVEVHNPQEGDEVWPKDFSSIVICIPDLLFRATEKHGHESMDVYIHDQSTPKTISPDPVYMGGIRIASLTQEGSELAREILTTEVALVEVGGNSKKVFMENVTVSNRIWTVSLVARDGAYEPNIGLTVLCGCVMFVVFACVAAWLYTNERRVAAYNRLKGKADAEQQLLHNKIEVQDRIVSNMVPAEFRDRLYQAEQEQQEEEFRSDAFGYDEEQLKHPLNGAPLADLYPSATVIFADISGFTAWSSTREPFQVFMLLERIFGRWDKVAKRHDVFKVETVGDCYVGVAGLPQPRKNHAVVASKFAREIMDDFEGLVKKLEVKLGPDTSELMIRVGIHSGQVTAGLLRGDRARYQLFGDTVNTTARVQTTSVPGRIQVSHRTAQLLRLSGRGKWLVPRVGLVGIKGKGDMQMFWLETKNGFPLHPSENPMRYVHNDDGSECGVSYATSNNNSSLSSYSSWDTDTEDEDGLMESKDADLSKRERLVKWNAEILCDLLVQIVAARSAKDSGDKTISGNGDNAMLRSIEQGIGKQGTVLEEFQDIVALPRVDIGDLKRRKDPKSIVLDPVVKYQMKNYISAVAGMYRNNHFHNFEHATHVSASVRKLLSRIVKVDMVNKERELNDLVGHSYGITSDPLTQFTVVLSAVIHDVDHPGVPNTRLVHEKTHNALYYKGKSIAEQNSVDLSWKLLMQPEYLELRSCIYSNVEELQRFRQLLVNVVMATDIADKELGAARKGRWAIAFSSESNTPRKYSSNIISPTLCTPAAPLEMVDMNRKATIVLEHLIQASDVCHTMQHWQIYHDWNEKFFFEMYAMYKAGRASVDPSTKWYEGEISFFDFYVIPLAKKLDKCGVFGVSSNEYLDYAMANREEWTRRGKECVTEYLQKYKEIEAIKATLETQAPIIEIDDECSF